tara:strand:+ start:432 stop:989 length:558 start_codon:yes stop_codon:yes gene_type:complete
MRLLIIDNFDSFTYNLMHLCEKYCKSIDVIRVDVLCLDEAKRYDKIIISPGPGLPSDFLINIITKYKRNKSILGVCLGAQAISLAFDCKIYNMKKVMHGKQSSINLIKKHDEIYSGIRNNLKVGRYHSWAVEINNDSNLCVTSVDELGTVMSFKHKIYDIHGVQYHPESILTNYGEKILKNWIKS